MLTMFRNSSKQMHNLFPIWLRQIDAKCVSLKLISTLSLTYNMIVDRKEAFL